MACSSGPVSGGSVDNEYSEMIRIDHRFTDATTAYVRFTYDNATTSRRFGSLTDRQLNSEKSAERRG